MKFSKKPTSFMEQVDILISRGMSIPDKERAYHYLSHLNYYRLGAYWLSLEADHSMHQFKPNTSFDDVLGLYVFDRELRLMVMDAIERFEVSVRTQLAYHLAHNYGPHAHMNENIFQDNGKYSRCIGNLVQELERSKETFVAHYRNTYTEPELPPVWAVVEVMSLGQLSQWYANLKFRRDRKAIANTYEIDEVVLVSFLHHLTIVRNICAHHGRLWNKRFGFVTKQPRRPEQLVRSLNPAQPKYLYNTLVILEYMMDIISPDHHWKKRLKELFSKYPIATPEYMGFPDNWSGLSIWQ